jgi:ATPase subunit of ABC transporter with duplicated ATPase domains
LLLLDEPTNHLDFPSVLWLENRLRGYRGSFLLVTHDRDLLVNVTTSTLLLEDKKIRYYPCGYGEFEKRKAKEDQKKDEEGEKFLNKHGRNADPSTQTGRMVHDMRIWRAAYQKKLVQMAGKFTFPKANDLAPPAGTAVNEDGSVTLIKLEDVRFSYNAEKGLPFIFDTHQL